MQARVHCMCLTTAKTLSDIESRKTVTVLATSCNCESVKAKSSSIPAGLSSVRKAETRRAPSFYITVAPLGLLGYKIVLKVEEWKWLAVSLLSIHTCVAYELT